MKGRLKPFTVEAKGSRFGSSIAKLVVRELMVLVEARPEPAPVSPSHARQMAKQMFRSLTVSLRDEPETKVSAESSLVGRCGSSGQASACYVSVRFW
jgi:hypothetical protein